MSQNLLDLAKSTLTPVLASKAGALFGLGSDVASKSLDHIMPTLLTAVLSKSASVAGVESLLNAVKQNSIDANIVNNLSSVLSNEAGVNTLGQQGGKILGALFADKANDLGDQVAQLVGTTGQDSVGVKGLLALAAPSLFGLMKSQVLNQELDVKSFGVLLAGQIPHLEKNLPSKIAEYLGWGSVVAFLGTLTLKFKDAFGIADPVVVQSAATAAPQAGAVGVAGAAMAASVASATAAESATVDGPKSAEEGNSSNQVALVSASARWSVLEFFKWLLPLILVAALVLMLMKYFSDPHAMQRISDLIAKWRPAAIAQQPMPVEPVAPVEQIKPAAPVEPVVPFNADAALTDAKSKYLAALKALEARGQCDAAALSDALSLYIVNFPSGSAALPAADVIELKKAVPVIKLCAKTDVRFNVVGHTDNVGNPEDNTKLSKARAESLKALFLKEGISGDMMSASGRGDLDPIADNSTEEGRFKNRRLSYTAK